MKTALQILIDNYENLLSEPNQENEMYERGIRDVIESAKTLLPLEKEQIKEAYKDGAIDGEVLNSKNLDEFFNSKYRNNG